MVSRETNAQIVAVLVGLLLLFTLPTVLDIPLGSTTNAVVLASFYAVVFGGAHLYLALVGEDDDFPVTARWRTVLLVGGLASLAVVGHVVWVLTDFSRQLVTSAVVGVAILVVLTYWYLEARDGYRDSRPDDHGTT